MKNIVNEVAKMLYHCTYLSHQPLPSLSLLPLLLPPPLALPLLVLATKLTRTFVLHECITSTYVYLYIETPFFD